MLFDGHAHIDSEEFKGRVEDVVNECNVIVFNASVDFNSSIKTLELASRIDNLFPALGFHPEFVEKSNEVPKVLDLLDFALEVSEVGLDYYWIKDKNLIMKEAEIEKNAKRFLGVSDWFELREKKREKIENYLHTRRSV